MIYFLLFIIALLYGSVGHGGASGYLALMSIYGFSPEVMKPTALLLNIFVSLIAFYQYFKGGHFKFKIFLPLALASIPMAYFGGMMSVDAHIYKKILGVLLLIPVARFIFFKDPNEDNLKDSKIYISVLVGASIGFLSGLIGIGGGIILSPVLLLLKWTNQKQAAAISALFIFVNSASGLAGQFTKGISFSNEMILFVVIALVGGGLGAYFGSKKLTHTKLKYVLTAVLFLAAIKLLLT